ncbi:MAG: hypothetical protein R6X07_13920 [Desulfatiglandales bacterium]|jgi:hypothetical protein
MKEFLVFSLMSNSPNTGLLCWQAPTPHPLHGLPEAENHGVAPSLFGFEKDAHAKTGKLDGFLPSHQT